MKKVAIYARVSTERQEEQQTIESQLAELREICKNQDVQIVKEYTDDGFTGETLDRPALDQLRTDAPKKIFERVYFHSNDRLSRNLTNQGIIVEELEKKGIEVFFHDKPIADTPEGKFLFQVLGAASEFEKAKILERTRRGRLFKARKKGFVGYTPPYGYNYTKKNSDREGYFTINKKEAKILNLIFDLYLNFQSITRVQKELSSRGIKSRKGHKRWSRSTIGDILRDETYIGTGYYAKYQSVEIDNGKKYRRRAKTGRRLRNKKEWIPVNFPVIIDKEKFNLAQGILSKKYKPFGVSNNFYLLSGLIRCALCKSTFAGSTNGKNWKHRYYKCTNRRKRAPYPKDCDAKYMRADRIEPAVWSAVSKAITNPKILTSHISTLADKIEGDKNNGLEEKKKALLQGKQNIAFKEKKLEDLYFRGLKTIEDYEEKMNEFKKEENNLDEEIREIEIKTTQIVNKSLIMENLKGLCILAKQKLKTLTSIQKQKFLRYIIEEILLDSNTGKAKITGYIPVQTQDFDYFLTQTNPLNQDQIQPLSISSKACAGPWKKEE